MKIVRAKAGRNEFSLEGLTLGMLMSIQNGLSEYAQVSPVAYDVLQFLTYQNLDNINAFGDELTKTKKR